MGMLNGLNLGDVTNEMLHQIRPYEITPGETERAFAEAETGQRLGGLGRQQQHPRRDSAIPGFHILPPKLVWMLSRSAMQANLRDGTSKPLSSFQVRSPRVPITSPILESPGDKARLKEYETGPTSNLAKEIMKGFKLTAAADADIGCREGIVNVVDVPFGTRPLRVHIDPAQDGAEIVNGVANRVRAELLRNMKLADLLRPSSTKIPAQKAS
jgi:hypothetical protein